MCLPLVYHYVFSYQLRRWRIAAYVYLMYHGQVYYYIRLMPYN